MTKPIICSVCRRQAKEHGRVKKEPHIEAINNLADPKIQKKFNAFLEREKNRLSPDQKKEIKVLENKALRFWRAGVIARAGKKCEVSGCKKVKRLNAHHIESFITNRSLRWDLNNGICLCPQHHKFGWLSAHRSFCFMYDLLRGDSLEDRFSYLLNHYREKKVVTKERLEIVVKDLSIYEKKGEK